MMVERFMPLLAQCRDVPSTEEAGLGAWQFSELMRMGMAVNSFHAGSCLAFFKLRWEGNSSARSERL